MAPSILWKYLEQTISVFRKSAGSRPLVGHMGLMVHLVPTYYTKLLYVEIGLTYTLDIYSNCDELPAGQAPFTKTKLERSITPNAQELSFLLLDLSA